MMTDPKVDEALQAINGRTGEVVCPCCGAADWGAVDAILDIVAIAETEHLDTRRLSHEEDVRPQPLRTLRLWCRDCGFLRSHLIAPE
jgi:hypothetical protein